MLALLDGVESSVVKDVSGGIVFRVRRRLVRGRRVGGLEWRRRVWDRDSSWARSVVGGLRRRGGGVWMSATGVMEKMKTGSVLTIRCQ